MGRGFNYERAAIVLCDAMIMGDRVSAERWGLTQRSVQRYRDRLENDDKLRQITQEYRDKQTHQWLEDMPQALCAIVEFMKASAQELSPQNPGHLVAITKALEVLADIQLVQTVVESRLRG